MILRETLIKLAKAKFIASEILFKKKKHDSSLYLAGYSIEMALKSKICKIFKLEKGFPENKEEFNYYRHNFGIVIVRLNEIKNHDLKKLLYFSGQESKVIKNLFDEWTNILFWNPELRYKLNIGDKTKNEEILISTKKLLTLILK